MLIYSISLTFHALLIQFKVENTITIMGAYGTRKWVPALTSYFSFLMFCLKGPQINLTRNINKLKYTGSLLFCNKLNVFGFFQTFLEIKDLKKYMSNFIIKYL